LLLRSKCAHNNDRLLVSLLPEPPAVLFLVSASLVSASLLVLEVFLNAAVRPTRGLADHVRSVPAKWETTSGVVERLLLAVSSAAA